MKRSRNLAGAPLLSFVLALIVPPASASASTGVLSWERSFRHDLTGKGYQRPVAARELADGSILVVNLDNAGVTFVRYDGAGGVLSTATVYPPWLTPLVAAIDPFGAVFLVSQADHSQFPYSQRGDVWTNKYDGRTGHALWPAAQVFDSPNRRQDLPTDAFVDPLGNVVVIGVIDPYLSSASVGRPFGLKYDGATGAPSWAPIVAAGEGRAAVDEAGNLHIGENTASSALQVSRYDSATGSLAWQSVGSKLLARVARVASGRLLFVGASLDGPFETTLVTQSFDASSGAPLWSAAYGVPFGGVYYQALDVAVGSRGEAFVAANSSAGGHLTFKLDGTTGSLAWGPVAEPSGYGPNPASLRIAPDGDLLENDVTYDGSVALSARRYDGDTGTIVWGPEIIPGGCCDPLVWLVASDGSIFYSLAQSSGSTSDTASLRRAGATGQITMGPVTFAGIAGGRGYLNDLTLDPSGDVIVTGNVEGGETGARWATFKYDDVTGAVLWGPVFFDVNDGPPGYFPYQVLTDAAGNAVVVGYGKFGENDYRLVVKKYASADGGEMWTSAVYSTFYPWGVALDAAGNPAVVGQALEASQSAWDTAVVKLSGSTGLALWGPVVYDTGGDDRPTTFAADPSGDLLVGAVSMGAESYSYVLKFSGSTGGLLWGPKTLGYGRPNFITADSSGDVIVTGWQNAEMLTIKYDGSSGAVAWGPVLIPSSGGSASGYWAAAAPNGDVFVTGPFYTDHGDGGYHNDITTTKFRGSDGAILWGPEHFDGPDGLGAAPYGVVLDPSGHPVVAGLAAVGNRTNRVTAIKYDGATGAALWEPVLLGPSGLPVVHGLAARGSSAYVAGVVDGTYRTFALVESLGIATETWEIAAASCGEPYQRTLAAKNGSPAYSWTLASGALPTGLKLSSAGILAGIPEAEGDFSFRVRVEDSLGASAQRDFTLTVGTGAVVAVHAVEAADCQTTLSVEGAWSSYEWLPGGQTTPSIVVSPTVTTTYGVILSDGSGCVRHGWATVPGSSPGAVCVAPVVTLIAPDSGAAAGGVPIAISGDHFQDDAWATLGNALAGSVTVVGPDTISAVTPPLDPGTLADVAVTNPDGRRGVLARAYFADFLDVPSSNLFHQDIETIVRAGITAGCGAGNYCVGASVTRAQMAVFLLKAEHGSAYLPPPCTGVFSDTPCPGPFTDWVEQLAAEGVTGGCGTGVYCPGNPVTRAQMAVFLLKTKEGPAYVPPTSTGVFADVPPGSFASDWIEDLYGRGITGGCSVSPLLYCPGSANTRGQMSVFLVKTFGL